MENKDLVLSSAKLVEKNRKEGVRIESGLFRDSVKNNSLGEMVNRDRFSDAVIVSANSSKWQNSEAYDKLWKNVYSLTQKIRDNKTSQGSAYTNSAQFPSDYYDLINYLRLDVSRRRVEYADYTNMFTMETVRMDMSQKVGLEEFLPYTGGFEEITGRGDSVPMIEHKTGSEAVKLVKLYGLGDVRSLEDELYNLDIYTLQKVNDAFARGFVAKRNDLSIGRLLTKADGTTRSYSTAQTVDQITQGENDTYQEAVYQTVLNMYKAIRLLKDPRTGQEIDASRVVMATSYSDAFDINRVINGQIDNYKGKAANYSSLNEVAEIWPYRGDTFTANKKTYTYKGITTGDLYMFVPGKFNGPAYTMTKRGLTYATGEGDVLKLAREAKVAYFGQTNYLDLFFGGSADADGTDGTGYIVKGKMPLAYTAD